MTTDHEEQSPTVAMFKDLDADEEQEVTEIESLCMNCQENVSIKKSPPPTDAVGTDSTGMHSCVYH